MPSKQKSSNIQIAQLLLSRLERISADSIWAHRASGIRGTLLRILEQIDNGELEDHKNLSNLIAQGFLILEATTRERTKRSNYL